MNGQNSLGKTRLLYCNRCKNNTNHKAVSEYLSEYREDYYWEDSWYRIWICAGCETATFEVSYTSYGMEDQNQNQLYESVYYPKRTDGIVEAKKFKKLPEKLEMIYKETIIAYNNKIPTLCATGLRGLLEGICNDKGVKGRNLEKKLDGLIGLLPENIVQNLHSFRFLGNEAIHELNPPTIDALELAIEIINDLISFLYDLDYKTDRLSNYRKTGSIYPRPPLPPLPNPIPNPPSQGE